MPAPRRRLPQSQFQSAASVAEQSIRQGILTGTYVPGEELREVAIADELGLSRTPVREALATLQATGLIEMTRGRTARVREVEHGELMEACELRAEVEAYTALRAAEHITDEEVAELWASCDRYDVDVPEPEMQLLVQENLHFHDCVHRASRNRRAPAVVRSLLEVPLLYASHAWYSPERRAASRTYHREITDALDARDGKRAAERMRAHVLDVGTALKRYERLDLSMRPSA